MTIPPKETRQEQPVVQPADDREPPLNKSQSKWLMIFTGILIIIALIWFLLWVFYLKFHVTTDDAYANGSIVNINSSIDGSVIAFYADDTDFVVQGQLLIKLDPTYYQLAYEKALANLAAQALQIREFYDTVRVNEADVAIKKIVLAKARYDYENRSKLVDSEAISREDFVHSRDDLTMAEDDLKKAQSLLDVSKDALGNTALESHPLLEEKKAQVREAYYHLKHCELYAPITGYVAKRSVNVGQSVTRTADLMAIIPTDYVWVDANFKETQLGGVRIGQPASIWFDLYGSDVLYHGKVLGISSGSGSLFSLIPPQNATGNWIKIVQRITVRISLDPEVIKKYPVRLGISAEVDVDITEQDLPRLRAVSPSKPVTTTTVYDIYLEEVNRVIDEVLERDLLTLRKL